MLGARVDDISMIDISNMDTNVNAWAALDPPQPAEVRIPGAAGRPAAAHPDRTHRGDVPSME